MTLLKLNQILKFIDHFQVQYSYQSGCYSYLIKVGLGRVRLGEMA